jgi:hypothetical protein
MVMAVEVISGQGTLRSEGGRYQRQCKLEITREPVNVDEEGAPLKYLYQKVSVVDSDDFAEGIYILSFNGQTDRRRRTKDGHYLGA